MPVPVVIVIQNVRNKTRISATTGHANVGTYAKEVTLIMVVSLRNIVIIIIIPVGVVKLPSHR